MTTSLPDQPITSLDADLLGRGRFAQSLAELISKAPAGSSLRIGVFGGWGEGKTSVLQLIQAILQKESHICVWLVPWVTESRELIAEQLTRQIAQALSINLKALRWTSAVRKLTGKARSLANLDVRLRVANTVFGDALERLLGKRVERLGEALSQKITDELRGRKLIVFVDDVDRVKSELVPNLLLTLREALDRPDFFYVMALSPEIVEQGLKTMHESWGAPGEFLEKIIEIPRYLPEPSDKELANFTRALIATTNSRVEVNALEQLAPLFPRTPRRLKLFVRSE